MNWKTLIFRLRAWLLPLFYVLGFLAPWERLLHRRPAGTLWLAASTSLARTGWIGLEAATMAVTVAALCCCAAGAALRVWGTAYMGAAVMSDGAMHGDRLLAAGPYRYVRNPLYLGHGLVALGISILMPPSGALLFLAALFALDLILVSGEERFLAQKLGSAWEEYCRRVPRFIPRLVPRSGARSASAPTPGGVHPRWPQALLAEVFSLGVTGCFAAFAWRYNALLLIKCLIVCYGLSLIARALPKSFAAVPVTGAP